MTLLVMALGLIGATACGTAAEHAAVTSADQATFVVPTTPAATTRPPSRRVHRATARPRVRTVRARAVALRRGRARTDRRAAIRAALPATAPYAVGERTITFVDHSRLIRFAGQRPQPRRLVTVIRYPTTGPSSRADVRDAPAVHVPGGFPLIVFGHGFAVTPATYYRLLRAWARAGYVVVAPVFPKENAHAPGGPDESDLVNQPRDMRFVITRVLAADGTAGSPLAGLIAPRRVAVSGQSDGGETALAVAYDGNYVDPRVRAAVILSGAVLPGGGLDFPAPSPPLLATQGTADTINRPHNTYAFFAAAPRPKYLLKLTGAPHLPPYTDEQPQLAIVERVTVAFLDQYLKGITAGSARMRASAAAIPGTADLISDP